MAGPSRGSGGVFSRGRLFVGILLVLVVGGAAVYGVGRLLRSAPGPGRLVYVTSEAVFERDLATAARSRLASLPPDTVAAWPDPGGKYLGYSREGGDLWLLDLRTGARWAVSERLTTGAGWTPDGRLVASALTGRRDLVAVDPGDKGARRLAAGVAAEHLVWVDDSRFLAAAGDDLVTSVDGRVSVLVGGAFPLAVSPDGREVLYTLTGDAPRVAVAELGEDAIGSPRTVFRGVGDVATVSPQGVAAFSGLDRSGDPGTWVLRGGTDPPRRLSGTRSSSIAWSRDGGTVVLLADGAVSAIDLRRQRTIRLVAGTADVIAMAVVP